MVDVNVAMALGDWPRKRFPAFYQFLMNDTTNLAAIEDFAPKNDAPIAEKTPEQKEALAELFGAAPDSCSRCGKKTQDIHTCTPPEVYALAASQSIVEEMTVEQLISACVLHEERGGMKIVVCSERAFACIVHSFKSHILAQEQQITEWRETLEKIEAHGDCDGCGIHQVWASKALAKFPKQK